MIILSVDIRWQDQRQSGVVTEDGKIQSLDTQFADVTGAPQYYYNETGLWTNVPFIAGKYVWIDNVPNGQYDVKFRDSAFPTVEYKVATITVLSPVTKCGNPTAIDINRTVILDQTDIFMFLYFPNGLYNQGSYIHDGVETLIPAIGLTKPLTDFTQPYDIDFHFVNTITSEDCYDNGFTLYPLNPQAGCDLVVSASTVVQPNLGQANGSITANATSSGNIEYRLDDGAWQSNNVFENLAAAIYTVSFRDDTGNCGEIEQTITLSGKFLRIAHLNGIEFKKPDGGRQNFDNTLFNKLIYPKRFNRNAFYCQNYFDTDVARVQIQSTYTNHDIEVLDYKTKALIDNLSVIQVFDSPQGFKYWEFAVDFSNYSSTIQLRVAPQGETDNEHISEPIKIVTEDVDNELVKVQWGNNSNGSDMYWDSGIQPFLYVLGEVSETAPTTDKEVFRDCKWNLKTISRQLARTVIFQLYEQPYYTIEKVQWATGQTDFFVNDVGYNAEEGMQERAQPQKYALGTASVTMEQLDVFTGPLSSTPTPDTSVQYLQVNDMLDGLTIDPDQNVVEV